MTSHAQRNPVKCCMCDASIPGSKWHVIRAIGKEWFFSRNGKAYCPQHMPAWVAGWRARNAKT